MDEHGRKAGAVEVRCKPATRERVYLVEVSQWRGRRRRLNLESDGDVDRSDRRDEGVKNARWKEFSFADAE